MKAFRAEWVAMMKELNLDVIVCPAAAFPAMTFVFVFVSVPRTSNSHLSFAPPPPPLTHHAYDLPPCLFSCGCTSTHVRTQLRLHLHTWLSFVGTVPRLCPAPLTNTVVCITVT